MTEEDVAARVERVFARVFGNRLAFSRDLVRADHEYWTSLKHMEFIIALELEFGVRFDGADAVDMQGIDTVVERIVERAA